MVKKSKNLSSFINFIDQDGVIITSVSDYNALKNLSSDNQINAIVIGMEITLKSIHSDLYEKYIVVGFEMKILNVNQKKYHFMLVCNCREKHVTE